MQLHAIDIAIILVYIGATLFIGFWISSRASKNMKSYFLGGNKLPWYALGLSNASGMFDVAGTMWLVSLLFVYGLKSVFIPWLWPVFNQIFLMVFLSIWMRRSGAMTGAEWITLRFGDGPSARLSHLIVVLFALMLVLAYMAYGFLGIGKLSAQFMPLDLADILNLHLFLPDALQGAGLTSDLALERDALMTRYNEQAWGVVVVVLTTLYVIKGGMYSVVFTEVMQFCVMTVASLGIAWIAFSHTSPEMIEAAIPEGWANPFFGWELGLDWSNLIPSANDKIANEGYSLFGIFFALVLLKGVFISMAGPAPNYDMQRILSARTPVEAAKMSWFVNCVLIVPRYFLIAGLVVLALVYFSDELRAQGSAADFEAILPFALSEFIPAGLLGLALAGLLAAFMSSFAAPLNAAPAYVVNDIYKKYINPNASDRTYMRLSYLVSALFVIIGTFAGLFLTSIDGVVNIVIAGLYGGYTAANVVKWYWWRMNGYGYFWGMLVGIALSLLLGFPETEILAELFGLSPALTPLVAFPFFFIASMAAIVIASKMTPATDIAVLQEFYLRTRPWGFWGPVQKSLEDAGRAVAPNRDFKRDMINVAVGIVWQTSLVAFPIFIVIRHWEKAGIAAGLIVVTSIFLKIFWYDRLQDYAPDYTPPASA
ncbi:sodium:solute symporter family protein [Parvularcula sp. LCG005]|uniref:sodium:solute symporter family protein n=1 Tax=Parvularcula sp. LCG005 TaxID=3078805 RepID=UPI00294391AA|nr:sodium:solute symporter family protein [Parvularcula sp. LCG005]WOI53465.1 sodium:solute symporter family protein [Parvularcula sp. LCG005]